MYFCGEKKAKHKDMCTVTIEYSENRKAIDLLLSAIRELGAVVTITDENEPRYNPEILKKAEESRIAHRNGQCVKMAVEDLWK